MYRGVNVADCSMNSSGYLFNMASVFMMVPINDQTDPLKLKKRGSSPVDEKETKRSSEKSKLLERSGLSNVGDRDRATAHERSTSRSNWINSCSDWIDSGLATMGDRDRASAHKRPTSRLIRINSSFKRSYRYSCEYHELVVAAGSKYRQQCHVTSLLHLVFPGHRLELVLPV